MSAKDPTQTIADIAKLANVSESTVSRALNHSPLVNEETRERIQTIAREQNFHINAFGRNLRLRSSHTLGFVAPSYYPEFLSTEDLFGMEILGSIGNGLRGQGYDLLVIHVDPGDSNWPQKYLDSGRVDGFILLASNLKPAVIKTLVRINAPFIVWGLPLPGYHYCSVSGDNVNGGYLATQHLIKRGRKSIAFLGGPETELTVQNRFMGYHNALTEGSRELNPNLVTFGTYSFSSGIKAMKRLLENSPRLDAVFVNSDLMAIGAISAIQETGRRVPEDIAVVGYDDLSIAQYNNLPLTTIRQNLPLAGKFLTENLITYLQNQEITNVITPVELVIRKSA